MADGTYPDKPSDSKSRRVTEADWDKVEKFVNDEYQDRKASECRTDAERIWKEVDRQIRMKPPEKRSKDGKPIENDWHAALELGELSTASEIIASDVMRIAFTDRWFQPHVEIQWPLNQQTGGRAVDEKQQATQDGLLRNLMEQQQKDFGLKSRFRLSVKESLHHGSFVAEVRWEEQLLVREGAKLRRVGSPVWVPYSMWNAYPDPSPFVIGTNLFYTGAMILKEFVPFARLKEIARGEGWIQKRLEKVEKRREGGGKDVELIKFKGDFSISRIKGEDIWLPNSEVVLANGKLVYYAPAELDYPNIIFAGYERQDVRDPYYTSPIIKQSPTQKMTTIVANKFLDGVAMHVEPPIEYDANDPEYVMNDGPVLAPGAKTATRSMGNGMKALVVGDPRVALEAYAMGTQQMKEGLGVSANRAGVREQDRETATAANLANQGAEVRTMEFISVLEPQALSPYLYMHHDLNKRRMKEYSFYNDEMHTPDFVRATRKDVENLNAHFEVTGSRGLLGEQRRAKDLNAAVGFFASVPGFAEKLKPTDIMLETFRQAGKKNPEEWVQAEQQQGGIPPQVQQQMQQAQQIIQQLQQALKEAQSGMQAKIAKVKADHDLGMRELAIREGELKLKQQIAANDASQDRDELMAQIREAAAQLQLDRDKMEHEFAASTASMHSDLQRHADDMGLRLSQHMQSMEQARRQAEEARQQRVTDYGRQRMEQADD